MSRRSAPPPASPPRPGPLVPRTPEPAAGDTPTPETPAEGDTPADNTPKGDVAPEDPVVPAPKPPLAPGPLPSGVPKPLAPGHGTVIPRDETVPIGFTWRGVKGAEAYILEIEEEGAEGRWMANARKPSKKTAVILEVERISTRHSGRLRWRVSAVVNGRNGTPSKWIVLK